MLFFISMFVHLAFSNLLAEISKTVDNKSSIKWDKKILM